MKEINAGAHMPEKLWVFLILLISWAALPVSLIVANCVFDKDVVRPGQKAGDH